MGWTATELADCLAISKKFERGLIFSASEESSLALLGPVLDGMRIQSSSYIKQAESIESTSVPLGASERSKTALAPNATQLSGDPTSILGGEATAATTANLDNSTEADENFGETLAGNFGLLNEEGEFDVSGIFDSECIPCDLRIDDTGLDSFFTKIGQGLEDGLSNYLETWEKILKKQLKQLEDASDLFDNTSPYMDLCALIKQLTDFECVPNLAKMLSLLMGLLKKQSFDIDNIFDLLLQFIAPLFSPYLSNLISILERYVWMIVRPIECIIDSLQEMLAKLDYNILFKNIDALNKHVDLGGPKKGAELPGNAENEAKYRKEDPRGDYIFRLDKPRTSPDEPKTPWIDGQIARRDIVEGERFAEFDFNLAGPVSTWIDAEHARNQAAVEKATTELNEVRKAAKNVDGSDKKAVAQQRTKERQAKEKVKAAVEKRDLSAVGRTNLAIDRGVTGLKSSLIELIGFLREGAQAIEGFFDFLFDEFKKLMGEYLGGSGDLIAQVAKKNALLNLIKLIDSIYKAVEQGAVCEDDPNDIKIESWLPIDSGLKVWTDDEGKMHIENDTAEIEDAIDAVVEASGETIEGDAGQKLKSLVDLTGDPALDADIARVTEKLTRSIHIVYECPLNTTVEATEQINKWIDELNE